MFFPSSSPDKSADPNTAVGCLKRKIGFRSRFSYQQVHQSKLGHDLVLVDVEPGVHEEVVHLHEGEDHVEDRVDAGEDVPGAGGVLLLRWVRLCLLSPGAAFAVPLVPKGPRMAPVPEALRPRYHDVLWRRC